MVKKFGRGGSTLEDKLLGILELTGWQAELARAALKQAREAAGRGRGRPGAKGKSGPRR